MSGDPPNIILGTSLGLSFWDFLRNNGVICLVGLVVVLVYFYLCFRKKLKNVGGDPHPALWDIDPNDAIPDREIFGWSVGIFVGVILLIATHTITSLTMPTIGLLAALAALANAKYPRSLLKQVDWKTVGFIIGLFLTVSGLEQTGLLDGLAQFLAALGGGSHIRMVVVLIWFTAITSAFVDNIPMATVMVPSCSPWRILWGWTCKPSPGPSLRGADIGGLATPHWGLGQRYGGGLGGQGRPSDWLETLL